ncbi:MAG TPA: LLM class flavin-dependent oxidoreductase [Mycobacteriales bacterium]|nr:LLM class flavin-dependent oxidoreductase [Mycobacteriales bacterium]
MTRELRLAVALDGAGWHPAAWRSPDARPAELFTAGYWADLVGVAERGLLDLVTIEDALTIQSADRFVPDARTDQVRGRLDAVLIAARVAPTTRHIGLVPTVTTTHTEPFHVSKAIATLDWVSAGRAGVQVRVGGVGAEPALFGRREPTIRTVTDLDDPARQQARLDAFEEAADHVEVIRRLWDSWEDDAVIRDAATGRYIDRNRLHYIDFRGRWFSVRGPSITPRPPQGQPIVAVLGHGPAAYRLAARQADLLFVAPRDRADAAGVRAEVGERPAVFADLVAFLDPAPGVAVTRWSQLDELAGEPFHSDARIVAGTAAALADEIEQLSDAGYAGVRLRPAVLPHDLVAITDWLVPELQRRGRFRAGYREGTLRGRLGLARPANRYATGAGQP